MIYLYKTISVPKYKKNSILNIKDWYSWYMTKFIINAEDSKSANGKDWY
jgi:hypothetical protein